MNVYTGHKLDGQEAGCEVGGLGGKNAAQMDVTSHYGQAGHE